MEIDTWFLRTHLWPLQKCCSIFHDHVYGNEYMVSNHHLRHLFRDGTALFSVSSLEMNSWFSRLCLEVFTFSSHHLYIHSGDAAIFRDHLWRWLHGFQAIIPGAFTEMGDVFLEIHSCQAIISGTLIEMVQIFSSSHILSWILLLLL